MAEEVVNRPTTRQALVRRYKWENLSEAEKSAVYDAATVAATRAGIGLGVVLTASALLVNVRRGKPPLPGYVRYGGVTFFSIVGAYVGFLTGGPLYARRILSVPDSRLAEDLRIVVGDWQARVPDMDQSPMGSQSHMETTQSNQMIDRDMRANAMADSRSSSGRDMVPQDELAVHKEKSKSFAYRLGLSKR